MLKNIQRLNFQNRTKCVINSCMFSEIRNAIMHVVGDYTKISSPPYTKEKENITLITPFLFRLISPPEQMHVCLRI